MTQHAQERLIRDLKDSLRAKGREQILLAITTVLGDGDVMFLSGLGVDGRQELLNSFIQVCNELKEEFG